MANQGLTLPLSVTSRTDVSRLLREVEGVSDFLHQAQIREPGTSLQPPKASRLLDEIAATNQLNLLRTEDRHRLSDFLQMVKAKAPVLHMSFSADPSPLFMQKLVTYLRREIHPLALVRTGLQPTIGAGCILRTQNKIFDFSLRQRFADKRDLLLNLLHGEDNSVEKAEA